MNVLPTPSPGDRPSLTILGSPAAPWAPCSQACVLVPFLPASSRKSAKLGGGPCNKPAAAMETRPRARGRIPASLHS